MPQQELSKVEADGRLAAQLTVGHPEVDGLREDRGVMLQAQTAAVCTITNAATERRVASKTRQVVQEKTRTAMQGGYEREAGLARFGTDGAGVII
jgi:hypothetical protein